jgi:outer membrane protein OmpA-like peptidoglycan-associated protein
MNTLRNALMIATIVAAPLSAMAQPINGLYVGAGLGYNHMTDWKLKNGTNGKFRTDGGFVGLGSVGWGFGNGLRAEIEGNFRTQGTKIVGAPGFSGGGTVRTYGAMVNALYDIQLGLPITPYVGLGGGYVWQDIQNGTFYATNGAGTATFKNQSVGGWAVQGIVGAAYPIAAGPGLALTVEGRMLTDISDTKFKFTGSSGVRSGATKLMEQYNYSGLVGVRYAFGAPAPAPVAPAPVAAPAPAPSRTYLVFFDWDRADLTARARQIIAEAAQASTRVATTRIEVDGHADRSGTAVYNQGLSMRRAQAVAGELVRLGVARNSIDIMAFGDTKPLVPTAAGVREPQNRRVEIILK